MNRYYKNKLSDFQVTENMLSEFIDENGEYMTYILTKKGISTFDAVQYISKQLSIDPQEIGYAGLKDEDGITEQQISLKRGNYEKYYYYNFQTEFTQEAYISLTFKSFRKNPIKVGDLLGNAFRITLRNLPKQFPMPE